MSHTAHLQPCLHALIEEACSCLLCIGGPASSQEGAHRGLLQLHPACRGVVVILHGQAQCWTAACWLGEGARQPLTCLPVLGDSINGSDQMVLGCNLRAAAAYL